MPFRSDKIVAAAADLADGKPEFISLQLTPALRQAVADAVAARAPTLMNAPALGADVAPTAPAGVLAFRFDYRDNNPQWLGYGAGAVPAALAAFVSQLTGHPNPPPPPPPPPPLPPPPQGVKVLPGQNWHANIASGRTILLPRGAVFTQGYSGPDNLRDVTIKSWGNPTLAPPRIAVSAGKRFLVNGWQNLTIDGIHFDGSGTDRAMKLFHCQNVTLQNCIVSGGSFGIVLEGGGQTNRNKNIRLIGCRIYDNDSPGEADNSGLYANSVDGLLIDNCFFDRNGWTPGSKKPTDRNHNVYVHGTCGPATITNSVFARASSHGVQARTGGMVKGNLFLDNPIHLSYGLVNGGGPVFAGGVTGEVNANLFLGAGDIGPGNDERGFCLQLGNIKKLMVKNNWIGSDTTTGQTFAAIQIEECRLDAGHHGGPATGVLDLEFAGNRLSWKGGGMKISNLSKTGTGSKKLGRLVDQPAWPPAGMDVRGTMNGGFDKLLKDLRDGIRTPAQVIPILRAMVPPPAMM